MSWFLRRKRQPERVVVTEDSVTRFRSDGVQESVRWDDLVEVELITTDQGPWSEDVFWLLTASRSKERLRRAAGRRRHDRPAPGAAEASRIRQSGGYRRDGFYFQCEVCLLEEKCITTRIKLPAPDFCKDGSNYISLRYNVATRSWKARITQPARSGIGAVHMTQL